MPDKVDMDIKLVVLRETCNDFISWRTSKGIENVLATSAPAEKPLFNFKKGGSQYVVHITPG